MASEIKNYFRSVRAIHRKAAVEQIAGRIVDDIKSSPQGSSGSPGGTPVPVDRAAQRRMEARRMEQERRRREAVSEGGAVMVAGYFTHNNHLFFYIFSWPAKST